MIALLLFVVLLVVLVCGYRLGSIIESARWTGMYRFYRSTRYTSMP